MIQRHGATSRAPSFVCRLSNDGFWRHSIRVVSGRKKLNASGATGGALLSSGRIQMLRMYESSLALRVSSCGLGLVPQAERRSSAAPRRRELYCLMTWLRKSLTPLAMPPGMEASEFGLSLHCRPFVVRPQPSAVKTGSSARYLERECHRSGALLWLWVWS